MDEKKSKQPAWRTMERIATPDLPEQLLQISMAKASITAIEQPARESLERWNAQAALHADVPGARSEYRMTRALGNTAVLIQFREIIDEPDELTA